MQSRYLGLIAILVIAYGASINLIEVTWKEKVGQAFPNGSDYVAFMGNLSFVTGILAIPSIFLGSIIIRQWGWKVTALITPVTIFATGLLFFISILFPKVLSPIESLFGLSPLMVGVLIGFLQNCTSKGIKYAMFDPTKEMTYIPLDTESKTKGKAAIDVCANRLGKSGSSLFQMLMIIVVGSLSSIGPILAILFVIVCFLWFYAVRELDVEFSKKAKTSR